MGRQHKGGASPGYLWSALVDFPNSFLNMLGSAAVELSQLFSTWNQLLFKGLKTTVHHVFSQSLCVMPKFILIKAVTKEQ